MDIFRVKIKAVTSYVSPLHSDSIFGAFCWAYRYIYGEGQLKEMLEMYVNKEPPIIFSNGFPEEILPFPMVDLIFKDDEEESSKAQRLEKYTRRKTIKKLEYLSLKSFNSVICGKMELSRAGQKQNESITYGNLVNRLNGSVGDAEEGGGLFERHEIFPVGNIEIYAKVSQGWEDTFIKAMETVCSLGIGADKSVGKGIFNLVDIGRFDGFDIPEESNAFVNLSNYIPSADDPVDGNYKTFVKYGKLDREFAGTDQPFKKPLLMIAAGAVFYADNIKEFYGRVVKDVSNLDRDIIHNGIAFTLPLKAKRRQERG